MGADVTEIDRSLPEHVFIVALAFEQRRSGRL
jgi:hypothetical protein